MHFDDRKSSVQNPLYVVAYQRFTEENGQVPGMVVAKRGCDVALGLPEGFTSISSKSFRIKGFRKIRRFRRFRRLAPVSEILFELSGGRAEFEPRSRSPRDDAGAA